MMKLALHFVRSRCSVAAADPSSADAFRASAFNFCVEAPTRRRVTVGWRKILPDGTLRDRRWKATPMGWTDLTVQVRHLAAAGARRQRESSTMCRRWQIRVSSGELTTNPPLSRLNENKSAAFHNFHSECPASSSTTSRRCVPEPACFHWRSTHYSSPFERPVIDFVVGSRAVDSSFGAAGCLIALGFRGSRPCGARQNCRRRHAKENYALRVRARISPWICHADSSTLLPSAFSVERSSTSQSLRYFPLLNQTLSLNRRSVGRSHALRRVSDLSCRPQRVMRRLLAF